MQKWEYSTFPLDRYFSQSVEGKDYDFPTVLEEFGDEGWELVNIVPTKETGEADLDNLDTAYVLVFKRPKE